MNREEALQVLQMIQEAILGETEEEFRQFLERHEGTGGCLTFRWRLF